MDSLTIEQFNEWAAYDEVMPLGHTPRMLGFIAFLLAKWLEVKMSGQMTLEQLCMPWMPPEGKPDVSKVIAGLKMNTENQGQKSGSL